MPQVLLPVSRGDAVLDQGVSRGGVRYPQQRLGEAKQRNTFRRSQPIFREKVGDIGARPMRGARRTHQRACTTIDARDDIRR